MYFLDTNAVVHFSKRNRPHLIRRVMQALDDGAELVIAPVVLLELEVGVIRSSSAEVARKALSDGHRARLPVSDRRRTVHI